jgi:tRNA splicing ligase|tara:strand:+ start:32 stop:211 length:180 start_codon:yes stop_codon:yes gene_type:complete
MIKDLGLHGITKIVIDKGNHIFGENSTTYKDIILINDKGERFILTCYSAEPESIPVELS